MDISNIAEKLTTIADNQQRVYDAGIEEGIEDGKKAEYDAFWDAYQKGRSTYTYAFAGIGWKNQTFKPKYDIATNDAVNGLFQQARITGDLGAILKDLGVSLITKNAKNFDYMFYNTYFSSIPTIDTSGATAKNTSYSFAYNASLVTIEKIILKEDGSQAFNSTFANSTALKEIRFEGVIGNTISFGFSPLSKDSILGEEITEEKYLTLSESVKKYNTLTLDNKIYYGGIVAALSPTSTGKTVTFKKTAKEAAFTDEEWSALTATRSNWTFSLS